MSSTVAVALAISGNLFDADRCSKAVALTPTSVGYPRAKHPTIPEQCWVLQLKPTVHESIDDAVAELLKIVSGKEDAIRAFAETTVLTVSVCCDVIIYEDRPLYELSASTAGTLHQMGAAFLLDIVDRSEEPP